MLRIWQNRPAAPWRPNLWDGLAFLIFAAIFAFLAFSARQVAVPYHLGEVIPLSLHPSHLPYYAMRTIFRMIIGMIISLLFTIIVGTLAAKNRHAERIILPAIDILQSVPVLGFLSITVVGFLALFPNSMLGPECAAIFAIFTAQVWNMVLGFYQSLKSVPEELKEAGRVFQLSAWQRFWRIEVPFTLPSLVWNMMMAMSAAWFFVVACEAISVNHQTILLPGIGSYIATAIAEANLSAVGLAILMMLIVIMIYDQLLFHPLVFWSERFRYEDTSTEINPTPPWFWQLLEKTNVLYYWGQFFGGLWHRFVNLRRYRLCKITQRTQRSGKRWPHSSFYAWYAVLALIVMFSAWELSHFVLESITGKEIGRVLLLGLYTAIRIFILIVIASLIWVPLGVWVGMRPTWRSIIQPVAQFFAAFPANLLFPVVVVLIITFHLNVNIWTTPLMILGTQWYILFNVIAGTTAIPKDLYQVTSNFGIKGWLWWKRFMLPGIFPFYITGAMTAAGGAWNASIVAEVVQWGPHKLVATGLGSYIAEYTTSGDFPRIVLGMTVMCLFVLLINTFLWQPLYRRAQRRYLI